MQSREPRSQRGRRAPAQKLCLQWAHWVFSSRGICRTARSGKILPGLDRQHLAAQTQDLLALVEGAAGDSGGSPADVSWHAGVAHRQGAKMDLRRQASFTPSRQSPFWLNVASAHSTHLMAACSAWAVHMVSRPWGREKRFASDHGSNQACNWQHSAGQL